MSEAEVVVTTPNGQTFDGPDAIERGVEEMVGKIKQQRFEGMPILSNEIALAGKSPIRDVYRFGEYVKVTAIFRVDSVRHSIKSTEDGEIPQRISRATLESIKEIEALSATEAMQAIMEIRP